MKMANSSFALNYKSQSLFTHPQTHTTFFFHQWNTKGYVLNDNHAALFHTIEVDFQDFQAPKRTKKKRTIKSTMKLANTTYVLYSKSSEVLFTKDISKHNKNLLFTEYLALTFLVSIHFHCIERVTVDAPLAFFGTIFTARANKTE